MLAEMIWISALLGLITAIVASLVMDVKPAAMFVLALVGTTVGWFTGMFWIFLTGGLEYNILAAFVTVIIVVFCIFLTLVKFRDVIQFVESRSSSNLSVAMSLVVLFSLAFMIFFINLPDTYASAMVSTTMSPDDCKFETFYPVSSDIASNFLTANSGSNEWIDFDVTKSYVRFPFLTETPEVGQYLEFQATFSVSSSGGDWSQPFIRMAPIVDENGNGKPDAGEYFWPDSYYKYATESGKKWRSSLMYQDGASPMRQLSIILIDGEVLMMPIFHANTITQWKDDTGKQFANTPELYTSPYDQISWDYDGEYVYLKEQVNAFGIIPAGGSSSIKGKLYCPPGYEGTHVLVIQAFDMRYSDPFDPATQSDPLKQVYMEFSITSGDPECGNGVCEEGENEYNCPEDCDGSAECGNGVCEEGEDEYNCPEDCDGSAECGNGVCEEGENQYNCPEDCGGGYVQDDATGGAWLWGGLLSVSSLGVVWFGRKKWF